MAALLGGPHSTRLTSGRPTSTWLTCLSTWRGPGAARGLAHVCCHHSYQWPANSVIIKSSSRLSRLIRLVCASMHGRDLARSASTKKWGSWTAVGWIRSSWRSYCDDRSQRKDRWRWLQHVDTLPIDCHCPCQEAPLLGLLSLRWVPPTRFHCQLQHPLEIGHMLQHLTQLPAIPCQPLLPYLLVYRS